MAYGPPKKRAPGATPSQPKSSGRSSSIAGGLANEIRVKQKVNLQKIASNAAKRRDVTLQDDVVRTSEQLKTLERALDNPVHKQRIQDGETGTDNLEAKRGQFVLMDGTDYEGSYHVHPGGDVMTEAVHLEGVSRYLVSKQDFLKNEQFYRIFYKRLSDVKPNI
tara:strand:- start:13 stop:504 length:492 start_codon:yes stop_codon:yes gene_type:complete